MHAGLRALAEEQTTGRLASLVAKVKALAANREALTIQAGKQIILARSFVSPTTFSKPESREVWLQRVRGNFAYYYSICAPRRSRTCARVLLAGRLLPSLRACLLPPLLTEGSPCCTPRQTESSLPWSECTRCSLRRGCCSG